MKIRKRHISCMIILLLLGAGIGSSYFIIDSTVSACKSHKIIKHGVSLVAGDEVTVSSGLVIGFGKTVITVTAETLESSDAKEQEAFVLLFFIL